MGQQTEDGTASFFVKQESVSRRTVVYTTESRNRILAIAPSGGRRFSFYDVLFRLSTSKLEPARTRIASVSLNVCHAQTRKRITVVLISHVFLCSWEPLGVITNPIPADN